MMPARALLAGGSPLAIEVWLTVRVRSWICDETWPGPPTWWWRQVAQRLVGRSGQMCEVVQLAASLAYARDVAAAHCVLSSGATALGFPGAVTALNRRLPRASVVMELSRISGVTVPVEGPE